MRHPVSTPAISTMGQGNGRQDGSTSLSSPGRHDTGPSAALLDRVRALDSLPRLGALRTLDLKGNDLRVRDLLFVPKLRRALMVLFA